MYISELKIHGFKSFADKVSLKFGEGVTGIVGPNGCGKTNIVDAIRWVLGEQKYSILRSGKMEDVIFNGADGYKPLGVCEVFLTVHNVSGKLPLEYNDIEIGRRVYRSGESEYFLNRQTCRLKDIQDLFIDTGMGSDAYSVIELKMVENILSDSGDDRKRMFEEAAGINKYKQQRRSALRKFEATHQDLERIKDVLAEVESKVHGLGLQLKRFKRHAKLTDELKNKEVALAWLRISRYRQTAAPLLEKIREYRSLKESGTSSQGQLEQELDTVKARFLELEQQLGREQEELTALEEQRLEKEQNILVRREQIRSGSQTIVRLSAELEKNIHRLETIDDKIGDLDERLRKLQPETEAKLRDYEAQKTRYDEVEARYREARKEEEEIQARRWERQKALGSQQSLLSRTETLIDEKEARLREVESKLENLDSGAEREIRERTDLERKKETLTTGYQARRENLDAQESKLEEVKSALDELSARQQTRRLRLSNLETQRDFYRELIERGESSPAGVRSIMERIQDYPGVLGLLGDQIGVPDELQVAAEAALGVLAHYLVVETYEQARKILAKAREQSLGEFGLLSLDSIPAVDQCSPPPENVEGRLMDKFTIPESLLPLMEFLLGDTWLAPSLTVEERQLSTGTIVDREGGRLERGTVWIQTGSAQEGAVIGRRQRVATLVEEIAVISRDLAAGDDEERKLTEQRSQLTEDTRGAKAVADQFHRELEAVEEALLKLHYQHTRTLEQTRELQALKTELEQELSDLKAALEKLKPALASGESRLQSIQDSLVRAQEKMVSIRGERDRVNTRSQELRIELINLENQRENLELQKRTVEENRRELEQRNEQINKEKQELSENISALEKEVADTETALENLRGELLTKKKRVGETQTRRDTIYEKLETIRQLIQDEQKSREKILEDLRRAELEASDVQQRMELIREHIRDQFNVTIPEQMEVTEDEDSLERAIDRTKRSIEKIGPVNMAVQAEYEEEHDRLELLISQRDDLVEAEANLRETIQRIDRIARKQFLDTFDQIKSNYERLFPIFFEGGKGTLSLTGNPDPLEADIAIAALPPGKKNQSLRMLSAGEKSLTAIALLFAIYQHKPSPYCILDEVDAPLDDGNIRKFINVLKKFSDETQFIVVTHNKLTMEGANVLYGVTMEKKGISKLVSVSLN